MSAWKMLLIAVAVAVAATNPVEAQTAAPSCAQKLVPCAEYINTNTTPPSSCCNPIKETVANELACLCSLYADPTFLQSLGINVTQAVGLSRRCGITSDLSNCNGTAPSPSSGTQTPPASPGGDNGAGRVAFTGLSFLLLFWASVLFN